MSQVASEVVVQQPLPDAEVVSGQQIQGRTPWQLFWLRFKQDRAAVFGLGFIVLLIVVGTIAPIATNAIQHRGPNDRSLASEKTDEFGLPSGPDGDYWFGADTAGRDLFVRVLYGIRTSILIAVVATSVAVGIGVLLGMTAGYFGGRIDTVISRVVDIILGMPLLLFAIGITAACSTTAEGCLNGLVKPGMSLVIFVIALFSWPYIARIVRGNTLSLRQREFIESSHSLGASNRWIMLRDVLPNLLAPIIVYATLIIPNNILFEATLSFLGLGLPQTIPSWGRMLSDAAGIFEVAWWLMLFPGLFLFFTTLAFNLVGDGLRDALDPRTGR